jgi:UDP-N-acetylmuramoylalanine--D-glutamate ligase
MFENKRYFVVGAGRSGVAAARFLAARGARVWINDLRERISLDEAALADLESLGVECMLGEHGNPAELQADCVVQSPGVPYDSLPSVRARAAEIPVIGEIELAYSVCKAEILAVTGTNGKTTTTALLGQMLRDGGRDVFVGGNIGVPFILQAETLRPDQLAVLEVSSFQLETVDSFRPGVSVILNVTPDHLERHGSFDNYLAAKANIFKNQGPGHRLILNWDDPAARSLAERAKARVLFFSRKEEVAEGAFLRDGVLTVRLPEGTCPVIHQNEMKIPGAHNVENALAAMLAGWLTGIPADRLRHSLRTFPGVEHRLEPVLEWNGILFVNDSKGTNPDASIKALEAFERPVVLIAGGLGKGVDYGPLAEVIRKRARHVVLIGQDAEKIRRALEDAGFMYWTRAENMESAVARAVEAAEAGDVALLSPACASYDMFRDFEQRGEVFKEIVRSVAGKGDCNGGEEKERA